MGINSYDYISSGPVKQYSPTIQKAPKRGFPVLNNCSEPVALISLIIIAPIDGGRKYLNITSLKSPSGVG
jgi:hypothetical protein